MQFPVRRADRVQARHLISLLILAFFTLGLIVCLDVLTPYVLTALIALPESEHGKALGILHIWNEVTLLIVFAPIGVIADKVERRYVYAFGFFCLSLGFLLTGEARSLIDLYIARMVFAVGIAASASMLGCLIADYAIVDDRGKLTGIVGILNGIGIVTLAIIFGRLPKVYDMAQIETLQAGRLTMAAPALLAICVGIFAMIALKRGRPEGATSKKHNLARLRAGFAEVRNSKSLQLAFIAVFAARANLVVIATFTVAWGKTIALLGGHSMGEALAQARIPFIVSQAAATLWPLFMLWCIDRVDRVKMVFASLVLAAVTYSLITLVNNPLSTANLPFFVALGFGEIGAFLSAQSLVGKEASPERRGSIIALFNISGSLGIMFASALGGFIYDWIGFHAPFVLAAMIDVVAAWMCWRWIRARRSGSISNPNSR